MRAVVPKRAGVRQAGDCDFRAARWRRPPSKAAPSAASSEPLATGTTASGAKADALSKAVDLRGAVERGERGVILRAGECEQTVAGLRQARPALRPAAERAKAPAQHGAARGQGGTERQGREMEAWRKSPRKVLRLPQKSTGNPTGHRDLSLQRMHPRTARRVTASPAWRRYAARRIAATDRRRGLRAGAFAPPATSQTLAFIDRTVQQDECDGMAEMLRRGEICLCPTRRFAFRGAGRL